MFGYCAFLPFHNLEGRGLSSPACSLWLFPKSLGEGGHLHARAASGQRAEGG